MTHIISIRNLISSFKNIFDGIRSVIKSSLILYCHIDVWYDEQKYNIEHVLFLQATAFKPFSSWNIAQILLQMQKNLFFLLTISSNKKFILINNNFNLCLKKNELSEYFLWKKNNWIIIPRANIHPFMTFYREYLVTI